MRELWARRIALLTTALVVTLAALFGWLGGGASPPPLSSPAADPAFVAKGQLVYEREDCASCHSVAGAGNPRSPLDRVAERLGPDELRSWTLGQGEAAARLPRRVARAKEEYRRLPQEEIDALVAYLRSLAGR